MRNMLTWRISVNGEQYQALGVRSFTTTNRQVTGDIAPDETYRIEIRLKTEFSRRYFAVHPSSNGITIRPENIHEWVLLIR